jgi:hypothetical protein
LPKKKEKRKKVVFSNIIDHAMCICISWQQKKVNLKRNQNLKKKRTF